eukprot:Hpha_TRINITY_DN12388_c0_g1::TRINITY_DN12388_c0_g1_i1::g.155860::m.155860
MGNCFQTAVVDVDDDERWWVPDPKALKNQLTEEDAGVLKAAWEANNKAKVKKLKSDILLEVGLQLAKQRAGSEKANYNQWERLLKYVSDLVEPNKLTLDGTAALISTVIYGTDRDQASMFFSTIDRDGNGTLDKGELVEVLKLVNQRNSSSLQGQPNYYAMAGDIMRTADINKDGVLTEEEFLDAQGLIMERLTQIGNAVM